jgi:hypothetical protein
MRYTYAVHRRFFAILLLLTAVLQGPVLTYAATLRSTGIGDSIARTCGDYTVSSEKACQDCCGHGSMLSCVAQCAIPGSAIPMGSATLVRIAARGTLIRDAGVAPFAQRDPPHPFRPPIA